MAPVLGSAHGVADQLDRTSSLLTIGILGGTGPQGRGLARRLALAGHQVVIGSRAAERAADTAAAAEASLTTAVTPRLDTPVTAGPGAGAPADTTTTTTNVGGVTGGDNLRAAEADLVIVTVPYDGHATLLAPLAQPLAGKIVVDCVNPLGFDKRGPYALQVPDGSAAEEAQRLLPDSTVISAFHHLSAVRLEDPAVTVFDEDVLVLGEDRSAVGVVIDLAAAALPGGRGIFAGRLRNAHQVEALTANLIAVNRRYKAHSGLRISNLVTPSTTRPARS